MAMYARYPILYNSPAIHSSRQLANHDPYQIGSAHRRPAFSPPILPSSPSRWDNWKRIGCRTMRLSRVIDLIYPSTTRTYRLVVAISSDRFSFSSNPQSLFTYASLIFLSHKRYAHSDVLSGRCVAYDDSRITVEPDFSSKVRTNLHNLCTYLEFRWYVFGGENFERIYHFDGFSHLLLWVGHDWGN